MKIIDITPENIDAEHICCAISDKKGETCAASKKAWLRERFREGLVFKRLDARGKAFIEYMPAENAWCPLAADNYLHINCFWVSGQFKGRGIANTLLEQCLADARAKNKCGLTALSSKGKMPFLSDPDYLRHKGFRVADSAPPYYELLYLPLAAGAAIPEFRKCARSGKIDERGLVLYYSNQCPHTEKYARILKDTAEKHGAPATLHRYTTARQAQCAPAPFTTYSLFYDGEFVTNEILSEKKLAKLLAEKGF